MVNDNKVLTKSSLKQYRDAFNKFDKYLEDIYSNKNHYKLYRGYLINLKDLKKVKETIKNNDNVKQDIYVTCSEKYFEIKQIEFKIS